MADSLAHLEEDQSSQRSEEAPQRDTSRGKEPADEHLPGGRRQHDVDELRVQEEVELVNRLTWKKVNHKILGRAKATTVQQHGARKPLV